ncbi:MAG: hypothetical protein SPE03_02385 [Treponema sp.]|nr:hypothetical protein [Treponema sp.]
MRPELDEIDYKDNHVDLDRRLCDILDECNDILQIRADVEMKLEV